MASYKPMRTLSSSLSPLAAIIRVMLRVLPENALVVERSCETITTEFLAFSARCRTLRQALDAPSPDHALMKEQLAAMEQQCARLISLMQFQDRNSQVTHNLECLIKAYAEMPDQTDGRKLANALPMSDLRELYLRALHDEPLDPVFHPAPNPESEELF